MRKRWRICWILVVGLVVVVAAGCPWRRPLRIIYDQGAYGDIGFQSERWIPIVGDLQQAVDDFTLIPDNATVTHVEWWGYYGGTSTAPDDFTLRIFEDNGSGEPADTPLHELHVGGVTVEATGEVTAPASGSKPIYAYSTDISDTALTPGTTYYISILNNMGVWAWLVSLDHPAAGRVAFFREGDGGVWFDDSVDMAFRLRSDR